MIDHEVILYTCTSMNNYAINIDNFNVSFFSNNGVQDLAIRQFGSEYHACYSTRIYLLIIGEYIFSKTAFLAKGRYICYNKYKYERKYLRPESSNANQM